MFNPGPYKTATATSIVFLLASANTGYLAPVFGISIVPTWTNPLYVLTVFPSGQRLTYIVYNTYETTAEDSDYMVRDTGGAIEISLSTCTDYDSSRRIIIWARAE